MISNYERRKLREMFQTRLILTKMEAGDGGSTFSLFLDSLNKSIISIGTIIIIYLIFKIMVG
jgi:hypothetical protein